MCAIARLDPHQHIGDGGLQAHELDALAAEAARRGDDPALDNRVGQLAQPGLDEVACTIGKLQNDRQPHAGQHRGAPHDVVAIRQRLGQFEVRRARFVGARARVMRKDGQRRERQHPPQPPKAPRRDGHGVAFVLG